MFLNVGRDDDLLPGGELSVRVLVDFSLMNARACEPFGGFVAQEPAMPSRQDREGSRLGST
jgi:hypothetical protein